jgi:multidrug efflux pump subunit AcrA (membrane-fusion protein)
VAKATLARVKPLAAQNAVSKMDLDNAVGNERETRAAVLAAEGTVRTEQLNLSYTTIASPLNGLSSYAKKQEGSCDARRIGVADVGVTDGPDVRQFQPLGKRNTEVPRRNSQRPSHFPAAQ